MEIISNLAIAFLSNFLYDITNKNYKNPSSEVYNEAVEQLSRKYPKIKKIHVDTFLSQEKVKKEILNYFESANYEGSFFVFKKEFYKILDDKYFTSDQAEKILKDLFSILDFVIENQPELREKIQYHTLKKIGSNISILPDLLENIKQNQINTDIKLKEIKDEIIETCKFRYFSPSKLKMCEYIESIPKNEGFIGRSFDLEELADINSTIIVIEGISGIGKTYLASQFALKNNLDNDVFWYNLNEITSVRTILCQLASFLKEQKYPKSYNLISNGVEDYNFLTDVIIDDLENGNYSLYFDDFHSIKDEHIKVIFKKFLNKFINTKLIVISRPNPIFKFYNSYDIANGKCYLKVLKGLIKKDTNEKLLSLNCKINEEILSEIHTKTNGHPIAIELFAISIKNNSDINSFVESLPNISEGIINYLFDEVYSQLSNDEKKFLKAISVYRKPINIDAIQNIFEKENIKEITIKLIDKQLIEKKNNCFSLHPLLRDLCYSLISDKESFHGKAANYFGRNQLISIDEVIELQYHLFKAKEYLSSAWISMQLHDSFIMQGYVSPLLEILLLYKEDMLPPKEWIFIGTIIGNLYVIKGDMKLSEQYFLKMLEKSKKLNYNNGISSILNNLSAVAYEKGDRNKALGYFKDSLELYETQTDIKGRLRVTINIGSIYLENREFEKAFEYANQAFSISKNIDDWNAECASLNLLGLIYKESGKWDEAINEFLKAKDIAEKNGDYPQLSMICGNLGNIFADRGEFDKAEKEYSIEFDLSKRTEDIRRIQAAYENFATLFTNKKEIDKALKYYNKSLELSLKYGNLEHIATTYSNIAINYLIKEDFKNSLENCKTCIKYAKKINNVKILAFALLILAILQEKKEKIETAKRLYQKSISIWETIGDDFKRAFAYHQLGILFFNNNELLKAAESLEKSLILYEKFNALHICISICTNCIIVYEKLNNTYKTIEFQEKIVEFILQYGDEEKISFIFRDLILNYNRIHDWEKMYQVCEKKIELEKEKGDEEELAATYNLTALALKGLNKYDLSEKYSNLCINLAKENNDYLLLGSAYNDLGNTYLFMENFKKSEECYLKSIEIKNSIGDEFAKMRTYVNLANLYVTTDKLLKGIELLEKVEDFLASNDRMNEAIFISQYIINKVLEGSSDNKNFISIQGFLVD